LLFAIKQLVNPSPIIPAQKFFIHILYTLDKTNHCRKDFIQQMKGLVIHKLEWKNKEIVENYRHRLFNDDI